MYSAANININVHVDCNDLTWWDLEYDVPYGYLVAGSKDKTVTCKTVTCNDMYTQIICLMQLASAEPVS